MLFVIVELTVPLAEWPQSTFFFCSMFYYNTATTTTTTDGDGYFHCVYYIIFQYNIMWSQ